MIVPTPTPSPDLRVKETFARTRAAFAARTYPSTIKHGIRIGGDVNGAWTGRTYDAFEYWPERTVVARSISVEELANPNMPPLFAKSILGNFGAPPPQSGGVSYAFGRAPRATFEIAPETNDTGYLARLRYGDSTRRPIVRRSRP